MSSRVSMLPTLVLTVLVSVAGATGHPPLPVPGEAFIAPLATSAMLLDAVRVDERMVAVGERGIVLRSDDDGGSWEQLPAPTRATLTGVYFHDREHGWAVGHDAVILRTTDGGNSWELVYEDPEDQRPLFDVFFTNAKNGFAIGAYGVFLRTRDGGTTWRSGELVPKPWSERAQPDAAADELADAAGDEDADLEGDEDEADDEFTWEDDEFFDFHLNQIVRAPGNRLYVAAESGNFFRSDDGGATWYSMPTTYEGSFFGVLPLDADTLLLMGLRGNLFRSGDGGVTWDEIQLPVQTLLNGAIRVDDGRILIGGMAGALLESGDGGTSFELHRQHDRKAISVLLPANEGLIFVGEAGVAKRSADTYRTGIQE